MSIFIPAPIPCSWPPHPSPPPPLPLFGKFLFGVDLSPSIENEIVRQIWAGDRLEHKPKTGLRVDVICAKRRRVSRANGPGASPLHMDTNPILTIQTARPTQKLGNDIRVRSNGLMTASMAKEASITVGNAIDPILVSDDVPEGEEVFETDGAGLVALVGLVADFEDDVGEVAGGIILAARVAADVLAIGELEHVAFPVADAELLGGHVGTNGVVLAGGAGCAIIRSGRT